MLGNHADLDPYIKVIHHADLDPMHATFVACIAMKVGLGIQGLIVLKKKSVSILPVWIEFTKLL